MTPTAITNFTVAKSDICKFSQSLKEFSNIASRVNL